MSKIVSEYDQEMPQSQTADNPMAPRGRAAQSNFYNLVICVIRTYTCILLDFSLPVKAAQMNA